MLITHNHFGSHMLATKDPAISGGPLQRFTDLMGSKSLRYPGGTITERIAMEGRFDELFGSVQLYGSSDRLMTVFEAQEFAASKGATLQFVLPTRAFLKGSVPGDRNIDFDAIDDMLANIDEVLSGKHGPVSISHLEIGNEFWGKGDLEVSATEYGKITNYVVKELQTIIDHHIAQGSISDLQAPKIAVQSGVGWKPGSNAEILAQLDADARAAIDSVVTHFYPGSLEDVASRNLLFNLMKDFRDADGMAEPDLIVTEWNIHAVVDGDRGLAQASAMLQAFDHMVLHGVSHMNVWGTHYKALETSLANIDKNHWETEDQGDIKMTITPAGKMFYFMAKSLPGTEITKSKLSEIVEGDQDLSDMVVNSYSSDDKTIIFLSSRSADQKDFHLDLSKFAENAEHIWVRTLSAVDDPATLRDEGDPLSAHALPIVKTMNIMQIKEQGISLDPFGIAKIEITHANDIGVKIEGDFQVIDPNQDYDDHLIGSEYHDEILGFFGDDTLEGIGGNNVLYGGAGDDVIIGGSSHDLIMSGSGADVMFGGGGNNVFIVEGEGNQVETGDGFSIVLLKGGSSNVKIEGVSLLVAAEDTSMDVEGFVPYGSYLFLPSFDGSIDDLEELVSYDAGDTVIANGSGEIRLQGVSVEMNELAGSMYNFMDVPEQAEIVQEVTDNMTYRQLEKFFYNLDQVEGAESIEIHAGEIPDPINGYGIRYQPASRSDDNGPVGDELVDWANNKDQVPPVEEEEEVEQEQEPDSSCFVATACYRDPMHPDVVALRRLRDRVLCNYFFGRVFIAFYWKVGPRLALMIRRGLISETLCRKAIWPAVWVAKRRFS